MNDKISNQLSFSSNTVNSLTTVNPPINVVSNPYAAQVATMTNNSNNNENNTTYETMEYAKNLLIATTIHQFPNYNPSTTDIQPMSETSHRRQRMHRRYMCTKRNV